LARRILLADDSVTAQNMGRRILHDAGYEVTTVNNGSAALKKIAELRPDLIILDVYMPGYGGLEVCSRLKENKDTARIPVLLTVGKLEPFKPEEARRVRADSYIVKPFEASELLTALTKLEDKIVPGPEPYKQGRFAKAMASVEHSEEDFGDKETGWKERLIIPGGKKKKAAEPEPDPVPSKAFRGVARDEDFRPAETKKGFERPIPAGLPQDISAEEIAAITAAAAKIAGKTEVVAEPAAPPVEETKAWPVAAAAETTTEAVSASAPEATAEEVPAATFASAPEAEETPAEKKEFAVQAEAPEEEPVVEVTAEPVVEQAPEPVASAPVEAVAEVAPAVEAKTESEEAAEAEKRPVSDAEVLAALASLTPAGGEFVVPAQSAEGASFTGPRWVAEAVAVADEESTTLLEHEMEKAYAAFAAADAGRLLSAAPVEAVMPSNGNGHSAEISGSEPVAAIATETVAPATEEAAYAAAASAGSGSSETAVTETQPVAGGASSTMGEPEEGSRVREAELAAAWANWRQIRETIVGDQPAIEPETAAQESAAPVETVAEAVTESVSEAVAEPVSEAVAEVIPEVAAEETQAVAAPAVEEAKPDPPAAAEQDPGEISSIVDNMLAELKPKLMEELKRKLGK
jgi:CheY-like chemotaxis protein